MTITKQYEKANSSGPSVALYTPQAILFYIFLIGLLVKGNIWVWSSIF